MLKEKQHIKNVFRSQSMASLSQIPVLNFSVCTLDCKCNNLKMPLHTSENVYNKFNCKKISLLPPPPKVSHHAQVINLKKEVASQLLHLMRKGNKNKTAKQRKGGRGVALCPCYVHLLQSLQSTRLICTSLHSDVKVCKQPLEM